MLVLTTWRSVEPWHGRVQATSYRPAAHEERRRCVGCPSIGACAECELAAKFLRSPYPRPVLGEPTFLQPLSCLNPTTYSCR